MSQGESTFCSVIVVIPFAAKFVSDIPFIGVTGHPSISHLGAIVPNQCKCLGVVNALHLNPLPIIELAGNVSSLCFYSGLDVFRE